MKPTNYEITIKPQKGWIGVNLRELWQYHELFYIFVWRDIKVRYKQTIIGIAWAILQPFLLMVVFSVFFGNLAKIPSNGVPYPIFVFSGLLFWNYFSMAITNANASLVINQNLYKKTYFPRLIMPLSTTITPLVDFAIALFIMIGMLIYYHYTPTLIGILLLPVLILLSFLAAAGVGTLFSTINVRYRDLGYALPFVIQILLFVTPVIYPTTLISSKYQWILALNPMTGIIEAARAGIIGNKPIDYHLLLISTIIILFLFFCGIFYFRKNEKSFADIA